MNEAQSIRAIAILSGETKEFFLLPERKKYKVVGTLPFPLLVIYPGYILLGCYPG